MAIGRNKYMNKLMMTCVALGCALFVAGCGNLHDSHEKMVKDLYVLIQSGNIDKAEAFSEKNFVDGLGEKLRYNRETKKVFGAIIGSKEPVKTEILGTKESDAGTLSLIAAKCYGTTLYFAVGTEKGRDTKIIWISTNKEDAARKTF